MFTGIVQDIGRVESLTPRGGDVRLAIRVGGLELSKIAVGDSRQCSAKPALNRR